MLKVHLDFETRSACDLKKAGAYVYSTHPTTEVICMSYKIGNGITENIPLIYMSKEPRYFLATPAYSDLMEAIKNPDVIFVAHNAFFEQVIYLNVLVKRFGWPEIPITRWRCTAAKASACALPRSLEGVTNALDLSVQKDMDGRRLILKYCKPRKTKDGSLKWWDDKDELNRIFTYCNNDVEAEYAVDHALPDLTPKEQQVWFLDQEINMRGVYVDTKAVDTCLELIKAETQRLQSDFDEITGGIMFSSTRQRAEVLRFLSSEGYELPGLRAKTVQDALDSGVIHGDAETILRLRQASSKTSTAKYQAFKNRAGIDSRVRDLLLYCAASTGRWGGMGIQPQNFPRGSVKDTDLAIDVILTGSLEWLKVMYGEPMAVFSSVLRGMITASPGKMLYVADYASIETRILFWVANNEVGLKAYHEGHDLYKIMAAAIYKKDIKDITKAERQLGKTAILGCIAEGTIIRTDRGHIPIEELRDTDKIFNGVTWVNHSGLRPMGLKGVMPNETLSIESTPDHWVLVGDCWMTALEVSTNIRSQKSAIKTANLLLQNQKLGLDRKNVSKCAAYAELKKNYASISSISEKIYYALNAVDQFVGERVASPATVISWLVENLESVGQHVSTILEKDVNEIMIKTSRGMAVAELNADSSPLGNFWNILLHSMGLISGASRWTELITTDIMKLEIYELLLSKQTLKIKLTYDISGVPLTNGFFAGRAFVHNCGYGMGAKKFLATCLAQGIEIDEDMAQTAVDSYRELYSKVTQVWRNYEKAACICVGEKRTVKINKVVFEYKNKFLWLTLPSGRKLAYYDPKLVDKKMPWGETRQVLHYYAINSLTKQWGLESTYGGKLTENIVQAISRDLMAEAMLNMKAKGFDVLLSVHDEAICEQDPDFMSVHDYESLMAESPEWARGAPIAVEGFKSFRYKK